MSRSYIQPFISGLNDTNIAIVAGVTLFIIHTKRQALLKWIEAVKIPWSTNDCIEWSAPFVPRDYHSIVRQLINRNHVQPCYSGYVASHPRADGIISRRPPLYIIGSCYCGGLLCFYADSRYSSKCSCIWIGIPYH